MTRTAMVASYMVVLLVLSGIPDHNIDGSLLSYVPSTLQNLLHIPAFGLLALLWADRFRSWKQPIGANLSWSAAIAASYGAVTELLQRWVPGRTASLLDVVLDVTGIAIALLLYWVAGLPSPAKAIKGFHAQRADY